MNKLVNTFEEIGKPIAEIPGKLIGCVIKLLQWMGLYQKESQLPMPSNGIACIRIEKKCDPSIDNHWFEFTSNMTVDMSRKITCKCGKSTVADIEKISSIENMINGGDFPNRKISSVFICKMIYGES